MEQEFKYCKGDHTGKKFCLEHIALGVPVGHPVEIPSDQLLWSPSEG